MANSNSYVTKQLHDQMELIGNGALMIARKHEAAAIAAGAKVAEDGTVKIKKKGARAGGGKQAKALELYKAKVLEAKKPLDKAGFVALLIKEVAMTPMGAQTYWYNCKAKLGERK